MKILITTVPFGENSNSLKMLEKSGHEFMVNPLNRKLKEAELFDLVGDFDVIIAGTETISRRIMSSAKNLKLISRVGIGLDGIDLSAAREMNIKVSYTPDAPAPAASELTIGFIFSLLRKIHFSDSQLKTGKWFRYFGLGLGQSNIGIIGLGRIGSRVAKILSNFVGIKILGYDLDSNKYEPLQDIVTPSSIDEILSLSDIVTLHIPLNKSTKDLINKENLFKMKRGSSIINVSRGGIINEDDLYKVLKEGLISGAAIDVFEEEPYSGKLLELNNCITTAHMGSMTIQSRSRMEEEAVTEALRFISNGKLFSEVNYDEWED